MEKIKQIRLSRVEYNDLIQFFDFRRRPPDRVDKYYVLILMRVTDNLLGLWPEACSFGVFDSDHNKLGEFKLKNFSNATAISFYIEDNKYQQAFLDYIQSIVEEMKLIGFTILETRGFGEDEVDIKNPNKIYLPNTEAALDKWRKCYKVICKMKDEVPESDEWKLKAPTHMDMRDRIIFETGIEYHIRTISDIIKAGEASLLD